MGTATSHTLTDEELDDYQSLTFLNKKEIIQLHKRFSALNPTAVLHDKSAKLPFSVMTEMSELRANPFKDQIMKVFSSSGDGMTFEDYLDMMSVFSINAPKGVKIEYAFRIYDFDGDDLISSADLKEAITRLTGENHTLSEEHMQQLIDNILEEADLDDDDNLSFAEFEHVMSKAPSFVKVTSHSLTVDPDLKVKVSPSTFVSVEEASRLNQLPASSYFLGASVVFTTTNYFQDSSVKVMDVGHENDS